MPLGYVPSRDTGASLWYRLFGSRRFSRTIEFRIITRWLGRERGLVLDLGAGSGEFAAQFADRGCRVVAFDLDRNALTVGQRAATRGIEWVAGDATLLPFADAAFNFVVCNSAIEHFPDDRATIREVARVMKPGGRIFLTTDSHPCCPSPWLRWIPKRWRRRELQIDDRLDQALALSHQHRHQVLRFYDAPGLGSLLAGEGLHVQEWRYYMNDPFSKAIFELHLVLAALDFYNRLSRRLYPLFLPFTFPVFRRRAGYGLAILAVRAQ